MKVAVVGGGLAGLAAAVELADAGARVSLFEGRSRLGGATFSFERNGLWLDNGQHVALRCCTAYLGFLRRLGVAELLPLQTRLDVPVLREGKPPARLGRVGLPAPFHLAPTLLRYAPLSPRERLAAVRASTALQRLDPADPTLDEQTFAGWLRAHGQSENAIESLWNLIALPTLNLPAEEAALTGAAKVFRTGLLDRADAADVGIPAVPFQRLHADPAAAALDAHGADVQLGTTIRPDDVETLLAENDAVVVAVPHEAAAELVPNAVDGDALAGLGSSPIVNLHAHYDRTVLDGPFAATLDSPLQWLFDRTQASGAKRGQVVAVSLSHAVGEIGQSVASLRERFLPAIEDVLPRARGAEVIDFAVTHEPRATFRAAPGSAKLRPGTRTAVPGLYLAGAWTATGWPATMEGAVRSGQAAAAAIVAAGAIRRPAAKVGGAP
ncbi:MAG TPA: hydroxysqualene dehydroxylase HpnE [Solirubrobacteraceae bacterium]|nr:hydroxysqualene dehydroxylase HpnE [Solirubrobacteraceae bacterium]